MTEIRLKSYILLRQPGLNEIILNRKQGAIRSLIFSIKQQPQQVWPIHVW